MSGANCALITIFFTVVELWDIKGAFIESANVGSLDYSGDDLMMIDLTLQFDNCVLQF